MIISLIAAFVSQVDGLAVVRLVGALHDAGLFAETDGAPPRRSRRPARPTSRHAQSHRNR